MKRTSSTVLVSGAFAIGLMLSGCGGSSHHDPQMQPMPQPTPAQTNFTMFTQAQFDAAATSETNVPVEVDSTDFAFTDDDNPAAFDVIVSAAM